MVIVHYVVSVDPGFPRGGCLSGGGTGGTNLLFGIGIIFGKDYMKMKKAGLVLGVSLSRH